MSLSHRHCLLRFTRNCCTLQIFGHISAAHLNPAVTIAFMILGQVTPGMALVYVCSECLGAVLGYGLLIVSTQYTFVV